MEVLVFRTGVENLEEVSRVKNLLTAVPAISNWNFDLDDCDRILRIEAEELAPGYIELLLQREGLFCRELD